MCFIIYSFIYKPTVLAYKYLMRLKIVFTDGTYIQIKLFDTPSVKKWFDFFKEKSTQPNFYSFSTLGVYQGIELFKSQRLLKLHPKWKDIKKSFQALRSMGFVVPTEFDVSSKTVINQEFFNQLHRFFTYNMIWYSEQHKPNPYDPSFKLPPTMDIWEWHKIIDPINLAVHYLERKVPATLNRKFTLAHYPDEVFCFRNTAVKQDNWLSFTETDEQENFTFLNTPDSPVVFLDDSILGKSIMQSFLDNDNPSCADCTGRKGSFGSFWIDFKNNRKKLYKSENFVKWLTDHNVDPKTAPYEFSIGYVEFTTNAPRRFKFFKSRFSHVVFYDN